jgi:hypothetical protein
MHIAILSKQEFHAKPLRRQEETRIEMALRAEGALLSSFD